VELSAHLGDNVRQLREARGLSQQQIAYAATDAYVGRELYLAFIRRGFPVCTS
jgi:transcriptional regulator with XRE-family HTH domain